MIKIEKGIEIPNYKNQVKYPFKKMLVGDSFFIECEKKKLNSLQSSIIGSARKERVGEMQFITRRVQNGIRCWRIK